MSSFNSKLFKKSIDLKFMSSVIGGSSTWEDCTITTGLDEYGGCDTSTTTTYDDGSAPTITVEGCK